MSSERSLHDALLRGVWGPHAKLGDNLNYGGPNCAAEASPWFKIAVIIGLLPLLGLGIRKAMDLKDKDFESRYRTLAEKGKLQPSLLEKLVGVSLVACLVFNTWAKYEDETMIFMLNPCHMTSVLQIIMSFCPFSYFTEWVALTSFAFNFGAWIGIFFPECEGYSTLEVFIYYLQHLVASFMGTLIFSQAGRFDILSYQKAGDLLAFWRSPVFLGGQAMFSVYMRLFLTPVALLTWSNLNHTLCGTNTDPVWALTGIGKWYYLAAEFYLAAASLAFIAINFVICYLVKRVILGDSSCSHGLDGTAAKKVEKTN